MEEWKEKWKEKLKEDVNETAGSITSWLHNMKFNFVIVGTVVKEVADCSDQGEYMVQYKQPDEERQEESEERQEEIGTEELDEELEERKEKSRLDRMRELIKGRLNNGVTQEVSVKSIFRIEISGCVELITELHSQLSERMRSQFQ